jgi:hypothetical protein
LDLLERLICFIPQLVSLLPYFLFSSLIQNPKSKIQNPKLAEHFEVIQDPRIERTKRHKLIDILTIAICGVICGADGWKTIEMYQF